MENLDYVQIGKKIKIKRKEMELTQERLSELIDVSPSYISEKVKHQIKLMLYLCKSLFSHFCRL